MNDMIFDIACMAHCNLLLYSVGEEVSTLQDLIILRQKTKTTVFFFVTNLSQHSSHSNRVSCRYFPPSPS